MAEDGRRRTEDATRSVRLSSVSTERVNARNDLLAVEEPLEIRLAFQREGQPLEQSISITMRTPGHDRELAAGFLHGEGILESPARVEKIETGSQSTDCNTVRVVLAPGVTFDPGLLQRNFYTTSSCGVCSKASLEALHVGGCRPLSRGKPSIPRSIVHGLADRLSRSQPVFRKTGGLHAAGLFDANGELVSLHEDVGRHNAVDKVVGELFLAGRLPLDEHILMVSGRSSFEIMQKALVAGIPIVAAVSAPSSLAVELAHNFGMTLLGFVRGESFNIYTGDERIVGL